MRLSRHDLAGTLRSLVDGPVLTPGDAGYDHARTPFFAHRVGRPAAVVRPRHAADVATTVRVAAGSDTPLFVRGGGHTAHSTGDGLLLDLGGLTEVRLDPGGGTAWAGGGHTAGGLTRELGAHGLAVGFGDTGSTGIGGLTLGGGVGFLSRLHGLTVDNLVGAEVVTADGSVRGVDAGHDPDLFWAIRGGGGNVGVVTRFGYRTARVGEVYGGLLVLPATPRVVAGLVAACREAGRGLSVVADVMPAPPLPSVPAELHGRLVVLTRVCVAGPGDAEAAVRPLRGLATPLADRLGPLPYAALLDHEAPDRGMRPAIRTMFLDRVDESAAATVLDHLERGRSPLRLVQVRVLGGAVDDVGPDDTAYAHRGAAVLLTVVHGDQPDQAWAARWADDVVAGLDQGAGGAYVNFLGPGDTGRVTAAYPPRTLARLRRIKTAHDPDNVFRHNVNITPEGAGT